MDWISVKDRLPDTNKWVLVWDKDDVEFGRLRDDGNWVDYTSILNGVTHWMPKPTQPIDDKCIGPYYRAKVGKY